MRFVVIRCSVKLRPPDQAFSLTFSHVFNFHAFNIKIYVLNIKKYGLNPDTNLIPDLDI